MFNNKDGFFHFVFANQEDDYYTPSYLKIKFLPYLRYQILQSQYKYIYLFGRDHNGSAEYIMQCVGNLSDDALCESTVTKVEKNFMDSVRFGLGKFGRRTKQEQKLDSEQERDYKVRQYELEYEVLKEKCLKILQLMQQKSSVALAMPVELLYELGKCEEFCSVLSNLRKHNRNNIFILTASVQSAENDRYFKNTFFEYPRNRTKQDDDSNIFYNNLIFPEIVEAFDDTHTYSHKTMTVRVLTYEIMQNAFGERMNFWNDLSHESIQRAVRYYFMHNMNFEDMEKVDSYVQVIWAWFHNLDFQDRYYNLWENPQRRICCITESLERKEVREQIENIAQKEGDIHEDDESSVYMCSNYNGTNIVTVLQEYRGLLRVYNPILSDDELRQLRIITINFQKPSYLYCDNSCLPIYCKFQEKSCQETIQSLFGMLKHKKEWNRWDISAMYILYILFKESYKDAQQLCSEDSFHVVPLSIFNKSMEALRFCVRKSIEAPYEVKEASDFVNKTIKVFSTKNDTQIRSYQIE